MNQEEYIKYINAVDDVCMACAFGENECEACPVRKTRDIIDKGSEVSR